MPRARFFFDAGSGTLLWREDVEAGESFVDLEELPVSDALRVELLRLVDEYGTSLNWAYPPDPGPWTEDRCRRFNAAAREALDRLRTELPGWQIEDRFRDLHEEQAAPQRSRGRWGWGFPRRGRRHPSGLQ